MPDRRPVLVAIDHATDVERAIRVALSAAEVRGADVHVIEVAPHGAARGADHDPWAFEPRGDRRTDTAERAAAVSRSAGRDGVRVRHVTVQGMPERVIPAYAQLTQARIVVVERDYGSSRFWRHAGVVEELARQSPVPLLVLPKRPAHQENQPRLHRIITPVDFSIASAVALRTAAGLARRHGARLTLVHALGTGSRDLVFSGSEAGEIMRRLPARVNAIAERLRRAADVFGANDVDTSVVTGVADGAILDAAARSEADLVVMGVPYRSWLDRMAFGSTLRRVLRRVALPVLVVPVAAGALPWPVIEDHPTRAWAAVDRIAA